MVEQTNLKELEKSVYAKFQEDGIWDIMLGLFFIALGLKTVLTISPDFVDNIIGFSGGLGGSLYFVLKRKITRPRIGIVKFSKSNLKKHKSTYLSLFFILLAIVLFAIMAYLKIFHSEFSKTFFQNNKILFYLLLSFIMAAIGFLLNLKRFLWYGLLLIFLFILSRQISYVNTPLLFIIGIIIFFSGIRLLIMFMKKYPKQDTLIESNGV